MFLKATFYKDGEGTTLSYVQLVDLSVKFNDRNDHVERNVVKFPSRVKPAESENDRINDEMSGHIREILK